MQHYLVGHLCRVEAVSFAPVIADGVGEDGAIPVEGGCADRATNFGISLETMFGILVPEVEGSVAACSAEGAVLRMEGDGVHGIDIGDVAAAWWCLSMTFE